MMTTNRCYVTAGFVAWVVLGVSQPARAQGGCERITDPIRQSMCISAAIGMQRWHDHWNSLTPRQQHLSRLVSKVIEGAGYGMKIVPVNPTSIAATADAVGASHAERSWVRKVMESHNELIARGQSVDRQLDAMNRNLCSVGLTAFCR